jgi:hypothetical protein
MIARALPCAAALALSVLVLPACTKFDPEKLTSENLTKVHIGTTTDQVKAILGNPNYSYDMRVELAYYGAAGDPAYEAYLAAQRAADEAGPTTIYLYRSATANIKIETFKGKVTSKEGSFK